MARPAKFERAEAIETAMQSIWTNGYERSSVKALSETLGMTRSSFYNAFGSRDDLFREAIGPYSLQAPAARIAETPSRPILPEIVETVRDTCRRAAEDGRGCMIQNAVTDLCPDDSGDGLGTDLANIVMGSITHIEELLVLAKDDGELGPDTDCHVVALSIQNLLMGLNAVSKVVREEAELWALAAATLRGLGIPNVR